MSVQFEKAINLYNQGYTAEDIATQLEISRATAYRWIKQHNISVSSLDEVESEDEEEILSELDQDYDEMNSLSGLEHANSLKERELLLLERKDFMQRERLKRSVLKEFKSILDSIKDSVQGDVEWSFHEVEEVYTKLESLEDKLHEAFEFDPEVIGDRAACQIAELIKHEFNQLVKSGPNNKFVFDWDDQKVSLIDNGLGITKLDDSSFDIEDFERQKAWRKYMDFLEEILKLDDQVIGIRGIEKMQSAILKLKESLSKNVAGVDGEFEDELETLNQVNEYFAELAIRLDESFWKAKRVQIPRDIIKKMMDLATD